MEVYIEKVGEIIENNCFEIHEITSNNMVSILRYKIWWEMEVIYGASSQWWDLYDMGIKYTTSLGDIVEMKIDIKKRYWIITNRTGKFIQ